MNKVLIWIQDDQVGLVGLGDCEATVGDCDTGFLILCDKEGYMRGVGC